MPAYEILGPLQISFGRMLGDISRFMVLFFLVRAVRPRLHSLCITCSTLLLFSSASLPNIVH